MSKATKEWIKLLALVIGTGSAVTTTAAVGGAQLWIAILCGIGTGATNLYHALNETPRTKGEDLAATQASAREKFKAP
jgi:pantothenate kinase type III